MQFSLYVVEHSEHNYIKDFALNNVISFPWFDISTSFALFVSCFLEHENCNFLFQICNVSLLLLHLCKFMFNNYHGN